MMLAEITRTPRLLVRQFCRDELHDLSELVSDAHVMEYYPSTLSREQAVEWLDRILHDYQEHGVSWWVVERMDTREFIGQVGILCRQVEGGAVYLLGYMLRREYWGRGYGREAVRAVLEYGFDELGIGRIECPIRPENGRSLRLARSLGLRFDRTVTYGGFEHDVYVIENGQLPA